MYSSAWVTSWGEAAAPVVRVAPARTVTAGSAGFEAEFQSNVISTVCLDTANHIQINALPRAQSYIYWIAKSYGTVAQSKA